jgi:hypothetical protein
MADEVWISVTLEDGTSYYYGSVSGNSAWDPPEGMVVIPEPEWLASRPQAGDSASGVAAAGASEGAASSAEPAPGGEDSGVDDWESSIDDDGREYVSASDAGMGRKD